MRIRRFLRIFSTIGAHGLDEFLPPGSAPALRLIMRAAFFWRDTSRPRGERLRRALESLGPVFVKFGQLLSVRRDLIPEDIADELAKLQDAVPPFAWPEVARALDRAYGRAHTEIFASFQEQPIASASVAQVHFATLVGGREVAVKILRPGIVGVIAQDVDLLYVLAGIVERSMPDGRRLRPREVVREFENTIADELDLVHEAANASQLRRNFADERLLVVPEVYWDFCNRDVMVMQRVDGIPVNDVPVLRAAHIDIARLARDGVEIFYTQVFRDGFFHADMHPGNILVARDGRYCGVDFGIMGTLSDPGKSYLAINMRPFFERNYRKAAQAHVDAGWVPPGTRVDQFESALRALCEPVFDPPLKQIYFGRLLLRLFEVGRRFGMEVQPQLTLLLKTMLQAEGLGRQLDPDLDLRAAAQPILERFVGEQMGVRGFARQVREEAPLWSRTLPQLPRLAHRLLMDDTTRRLKPAVLEIARVQRVHTRAMVAAPILVLLLIVGLVLR